MSFMHLPCLSEETNEYKMPFEVEVGSNPSLEHMKMVVVVNSQRPKIKPGWLKHHVTCQLQISILFYLELWLNF